MVRGRPILFSTQEFVLAWTGSRCVVPCYGDIPQEIHLPCVTPGQSRHGLLERKEILMLTRRKTLQLAATALAMPFVVRSSWAQTYPTRPVRILLGFAAGGGTDVAARVMAEWLSQQFRQQFIVENRLGM